jgi:two-component sensor histidine kinase
MKPKLSLAFLFIFFSLCAPQIVAQNKIEADKNSEYQSVKALLDSCAYYFEKDQAKYKAFARQFAAVDFSELADSSFRQLINQRTDFLRRNFQYEEAIPILTQAIAIAEKKKDTLSQAFFHKALSTHYYRTGNLDSTLDQLDLAYLLYEYLDNRVEMGIIAIRKARVAYDLGNYENSVKYSFEAIELHRDADDQEKLAISHLQLGNTYLYLSSYDAAIKYFELARSLFKEAGNDFGYAESILNIGLANINNKNYREGMKQQFAVLDYFLDEGYAIEAGVCYINVVSAYLGLEKYDSCLHYNELAKEQFEKARYKRGICQAYLYEAKVFFATAQTEKALESATNSHRLAKENDYFVLLRESNLELYQINKRLNKQKESFYYLEQYVKLKDSLNFDPNTLQSKAMKYQLAAEEAALQLELAEERTKLEFERGEKAKQQLYYSIIISVLIMISLLITAFYLYKNRKLNKRLSRQSELLAEDLKVKEALLSEIHHRVKNNLQVIRSMLSLQNQFISDQSVRKVIDECNGRIVSMSLIHENLYRKQDFQEAQFNNYIEELVPRLVNTYGTDSNKIHLEMDIAPIKLSLDDSVPCGLLLNEIISNALKHGFPNGRAGSIKIALKQINDEVHLLIKDDGVGLEEGKSFESNDSFGFLLIETMASQLGADLSIETSNGFEYHIKWKKAQ